MIGWILVGEKSADLHDLITFIDTFEQEGVPLKKVFAKDIAVFSGIKKTVFINNLETPIPDFVISAFFGNNDYHNRSVVKMLESMGVLCINNYACLIDTCDKLKSFHLVKEHVPNALLPKTLLYEKSIPFDFIHTQIGFPVIAKINHGAKGTGVYLVKSQDELEKIIYEMETSFEDQILLQEYIESSAGKDLRFILCGGKIITCFIRENEGDFKSNLAVGGHIEFFNPPEELIETALLIGNALSINLGSVDFLIGENNKYYLCEANSMPGLSYAKASGEYGIRNPLLDIVENIKEQALMQIKRNGF